MIVAQGRLDTRAFNLNVGQVRMKRFKIDSGIIDDVVVISGHDRVEELGRPPVLLTENDLAALQAAFQVARAFDYPSSVDFLDIERLLHGLHGVADAGALAIA